MRAALAFALAATSLYRIEGADIWWHVRTGRWIWEHGAIPTQDPFSHTAAGPWTYTDALAQLLYFGAHEVAGPAGVVWLSALVVLLIGLTVGRLLDARPAAAAAAFALYGVTCQFRFVAKPHLFSDLLFACLLLVIRRVEAGGDRRALALVPPAFAVWGNLHRGGALGLVALGLTGAAWALDRRRRAWLPALGLASALGAAALTLNSGGVGYLGAAFDLTRRESFRAYLPEWQGVNAAFLAEQPWIAVIALAWAASWLRHRRVDAESLIAASTLALAASSVRFVPYAAIATAPGIARGLDPLLGAASRTLAAVAAVAALGGWFVVEQPPSTWGPGVAAWKVPVDAAAFLRRAPPPGRMWNTFNLGGYLLYALAPEVPVAIDGRNDTVYSSEFFAENVRAKVDPATLAALLERTGADFAVTESGPLGAGLRWLHGDPGWQLVYLDDVAAVVVRRTPATAAYLAVHGYRALRATTAPGEVRGAAALDALENARRAPESVRAAFLAALAHRSQGDAAAAEAALARAAALATDRDLDFTPR